ncbi:MAG: hypothetical protein PGN33_20030 [Methylobacterium radiotolerans]
MAHANPEFALGLMRHEASPVRFQTRPPRTLNSLRLAMQAMIAIPAEERTPEQQRQIDLYFATSRQTRHATARGRTLDDALAEPVGGMHGADKRAERFVEPKRRYPADVQAGREKLRRGTLPR